MPPYLQENVAVFEEENKDNLCIETPPRKYKIIWFMLVYFVYIHVVAMYGLYLGITSALWTTIAFTYVMYLLSILGISAGVHRLWTHKAYKAKLPLQIFLMLCHSTTNTHTAIRWIRDHTLHHKYTDTDADPHNSRRGFFYSHIGNLLVRKHPDCREKARLLDSSELYVNPVLQFQHKNAIWLISSLAFTIPSLVPLLWNEEFTVAFHMNILRVFLATSAGLLVNSFAHMYGYRPYDKSIRATQNKIISFFTLGEGFHNYHHVFPHDYRTAELGDNFLNPTTKFIDFCAWINQAYDLKYVTDAQIEARMKRTGEKAMDSTYKSH